MQPEKEVFMQFESKDSIFGTLGGKPSRYFELVSGLIKDKITASKSTFQAGNIIFEKGLDCVVTPLLYTHNQAYRDFFVHMVSQCRAAGCDAVLVIGIGGSSLGASAVYEALGREIITPIYFLETIDPDQYENLEGLLRDGGAVQVVIISKSGTTLETAVNSSLAVDLLKKYKPEDWSTYITIISDEQSPLFELAEKHDLRALTMPEVGGRFSVFTAVGLFPLALAGIDIDQFCQGACAELDIFLEQGLASQAVVSAQTLYAAYQQGYWVHDIFIWDAELEQLGKWYRQLIAESLGKRENIHGETIESGILPVVSMGTQDLHSMVQLYLGGPRQIITTFVSAEPRAVVTIPKSDWGKSGCAGRDLAAVREGLLKGVQRAYQQDKRPFMAINLDKTAFALGQCMMFKILEIILMGALFEINVFDQPEVEKYKRAARKFLGDA